MRIGGPDPEQRKSFTRRAALAGGGLGLLFAGVGARLYQLQVARYTEFQRLAEENQFNRRPIAPTRGVILDRFGAPLAANRQNFRLVFDPQRAPDVEAALDDFARYVDIPPERRERILREIRRTGGLRSVQVADDLGWEAFVRLNYALPDLPGAIPEVADARDYPLGAASAFVVGYVGAVTAADLENPENDGQHTLLRQPGFRVGRQGLERSYEQSLRGKAGEMRVRVNAHGRVLEEVRDAARPAQPGSALVLTVDSELQRQASEILAGESAAAVVLDVKTGDILALASTPSFDPNVFNAGVPVDRWRELSEDPYKPLLNKPLSGLYPPGSTFKPVTAIAAQRSGIAPDFAVHCPGRFWYGGRFFYCWKRGGHGGVGMRNSIKKSCDVYYYRLATMLDIDLIADTAAKLGLGQTYDLGVAGEKAGIVPSRAWKKERYADTPDNRIWFPGETLSVAIGQGAATATPLQLAVMTARIATGREVRPRLVRMVGEALSPPPDFPALSIPQDYFTVAREGMDGVVNEWGGTARRSMIEEPEWRMAGKTGTSQVYRITAAERARGLTKPEQLPWERRDHALFVCYAPFDAPRYACAVVVEHGIGGSRTAAPKARDIMRATLARDPAARRAFGPEQVAAAAAAAAG